MTRKHWIVIGVVVALLSSVIAVFAALLESEAGLRWVLARVGAQVPGQLSFGAVHGRLRGPIALDNVRYKNAALELAFERIELEWNPWLLFADELRVNRLHLRGVRYVGADAKPDSAALTLPDIVLPIHVTVDELRVTDARLRAHAAAPELVIDDVGLAASMFGARLNVERLDVRAPQFDLRATGTLETRGAYAHSFSVDWGARISTDRSLRGRGDVRGDTARIELQQHVTEPVVIEVQGNLHDPLQAPRWDARISAKALDLKPLIPDWPLAVSDLDVSAQGDLRSVQARIALRSAHDSIGAFELDTKAAFDGADAFDLADTELRLVDSDTRLRLNGRVTMDFSAGTLLRAEARGSWDRLRWPLRGAAQVVSTRGEFEFEGDLQRYAFALRGPVVAAQLPGGDWRISGSGDRTHVDFSDVRVATLDGNIAGQVQLSWPERLHWQASLRASGLNPGAHWPQWPGALAFELASTGALQADGPRAGIELTKLVGRLRDYAVQGEARVDVKGDAYAIQSLQLRSGSATARARGTVADTWKLEAEVNAPRLQEVHPKLAGELNATLAVTGARAAPSLRFDLRGKDVRSGAAVLAELAGNGAIHLDPQQQSRFELVARRLNVQAQTVDEVRVLGEGTQARHRVVAVLRAPDAGAELDITGGASTDHWEGRLTRADVSHARYGAWTLERAVPVTVGSAAAEVQALCVAGDNGRICAQGRWAYDTGATLQATLASLPLTPWLAALPRDVQLSGLLNGSLTATYTAAAPAAVTADVALKLTPGVLKLGGAGEEPLSFEHEGGDLTVKLDAQGVQARARVEFAALGNAVVTVALPGWRPGVAAQEQALRGRIQANINQLDAVASVAATLEDTRGRVHADVGLGGTLAAPRFDGKVTLTEGSATLPQLGIALREVTLEAHNRGEDQIEFSASASSGPGVVNITGKVELDRARGWPLVVDITGKDFEAVNLPEARVLASPALSVYVARNRIDLNGELFIPQARYNARDVSEAVAPSRDVVIVGRKEQAPKEEKWQIYTTVRFAFGDDVTFKGFGLKGKVRGQVVALDEPKKLTTGYGELQIVDATFNAYKIDLRVERGRLLFAGGPINNPGIDARAVREAGTIRAMSDKKDAAQLREPGGIVVGVNVRGTLRNLELVLFSEPSRDQADILSLLLFGVPLGEATSEEGKALFLAASSLRLSGRDDTVRKIGRRFGIEEIRLETGTTPEQASLVIGRYLGPRLYVNYSVGLLANTTNILRIRYRISSKWVLQSEQSDVESAADLLYTIER